jgi:hypothetical protein
MSQAHVEQLVSEMNMWASFGKNSTPLIDANNLTQADANELYEKIDCKFSPENLYCDGEASPAQVRRTYAMLTGAVKTLDAQFTRPANLYEI